MLRLLPAILVICLTGPALAETGRPADSNTAGSDAANTGTVNTGPAPLADKASLDAASLDIVWEVKNRFRLFKNETDFARHLAAWRGDGVLASEQRLAAESDGHGWARGMVKNLCVDASGSIPEFCERDGEREHFMAPRDLAASFHLSGNAPPEAACTWTFTPDEADEGETKTIALPCEEEVRLRLPPDRAIRIALDITLPDFSTRRVEKEIRIRNLLIAGMGDSIASGDGNPDSAVKLTDDGFCFRRFLAGTTSEFFRPSRAGFKGDKACTGPSSSPSNAARDWAKLNATWMHAGCHRSLYSYQLRAALAIAIEQPHVAVTFLPLACSGNTIEAGFFKPSRARECPPQGRCITENPAQISSLREAMKMARAHDKDRKLDLVLLTIGANDMSFDGLVANVIVDAPTERSLFTKGGMITDVATAQKILDTHLPRDFARLRTALKPYLGDDLSRVVYLTYANPALIHAGDLCRGSKSGFDVHPAFNVDPQRLKEVSDFVDGVFLPRMRALALCEEDGLCGDADKERMIFVDSHQDAFADHGFCALGDRDPAFDHACFSRDGDSFEDNPAIAATAPLRCDYRANEFRPYLPRARWIRTANDSYFSAMTFPEGLSPALQPSDLHDAIWGAASAVYGGAIHPTAEGHAAMADAALASLRAALGIQPPSSVQAESLPPLDPSKAEPQNAEQDATRNAPQDMPQEMPQDMPQNTSQEPGAQENPQPRL